MSRYTDFHVPTAEQRASWAAWLAQLPEHVRAVAAKLNPWTLYRLKSSGHRVVLHSLGDDDADSSKPILLTVNVLGKFNFVSFERRVTGVVPEDLEECELPAPGEKLGSLDLDPLAVALAHQMGGAPRRTRGRPN